MAQARGTPHRVLPTAPHASSKHARKDRKTKLIILSNSASQDPDLCRAHSKNPKIWDAQTSAPLLCCSQSGLRCQGQPWAGVVRITKLMKWSDQVITAHCKGEELLIQLCLAGVTYTLWLWRCHLLILFSNLLHKLASQIASLNSPLNKEARQCTGNKLYLTSTQFEDQKEVCLTLHYLHFLIFTGFCSSCYQTAQKAELIGKTLTSAAGAENIISQTDGIFWWLPAQFLWASYEEFLHENIMNFHKVTVRALWGLSFTGKFMWFSQQGQ